MERPLTRTRIAERHTTPFLAPGSVAEIGTAGEERLERSSAGRRASEGRCIGL